MLVYVFGTSLEPLRKDFQAHPVRNSLISKGSVSSFNSSEQEIDHNMIQHIKHHTTGNNSLNVPSEKDISIIIDIIRTTYLDHQLFPKSNGTFKTQEEIRISCINKVFLRFND